MDDLVQAENIDQISLNKANQATSGMIQLQRGGLNGKTLLHHLSKKDEHNELANLLDLFPGKIFSSRSARQESQSILKCLVDHHHLDTLKHIIESASLNPSTCMQHFIALTTLMKEFVKLGNR